jgi:uncharacterized protein (TIGR03067 family)
MRSRNIILLLFFTGSMSAILHAAPVPKDRKKSGSDIIGKWLDTVSTHGEQPPKPVSGKTWFKFGTDGQAWVVNADGKENPLKYTTGADGIPNAVDWIAPWGTWIGLYEIQGKTLRMVLCSGNKRPTEIKPQAGSEYHEFTLDD